MSVDDRVVSMSFANGKFEQAVQQTVSTLDKLKAALRFPGAGDGLKEVDASAEKSRGIFGRLQSAVSTVVGKLFFQGGGKGFNEAAQAAGNATKSTSALKQSVQQASASVSAFQVAAVGALLAIGAKAVQTGASIAKALTIKAPLDGFKEYETGIKSVQTILANTQAAGTTLKDVEKALQELNVYADKTIYNFGEMTRNIGTFTAAGVDLETSVASIKGLSNVAALSGSTSAQASSAMYQLSQAVAAGKVTMQDWISVRNAGMGGAVFQRALAQTAEAMGTIDKGAVKLEGKMKNVSIAGESFADSIRAKPGEESWLTSDVLTATLSTFTGDLKDADLAAMGFNDSQIKAIQAQAKTALSAATEVKTLSDLIGTTQEQLGTGWADTFKIIFGGFNEAKALFTGISVNLGGFIEASAKARNSMLQTWKDLGGRDKLILGLKNAFDALMSILRPIGEAFRQVFPRTTGKQLYELTVRFAEFTEKLKIGPETADKLKRSFAGLFAVLSIAKQVVGAALGVIGSLIGKVAGGSGGFLSITAAIGDFVVKIDEALKKGDLLDDFFGTIGNVLAIPLDLILRLAKALGDLFSGFSDKTADKASGSIDTLGKVAKPAANATERLQQAWEGFLSGVENAKGAVAPVVNKIKEAFEGLGEAFRNTFGAGELSQVLDILQTGFLGGILFFIRKFVKDFSIEIGGGLFDNVNDALENLTGTLGAMQNNIQADTLKKIAVAVALLTGSLVVLSLIDGKKLASALTALGVAMGQLLVAMGILTKIAGLGGFVTVPIIAASMILLAGAVNVLTISVFALAQLSWEELAKGLGGVAALLALITAAAIPLSKNSAGLISAGVGITAMAVGIRILASAVSVFAEMSVGEIAKGIGAIAASLLTLSLAIRAFPPGMASTGLAILAISSSLGLLASAVEKFAKLGLENTARGLFGIGASLVVLGAAIRAFPPSILGTAVAIGVLSLALQGIAAAVITLGSAKLETTAKGLGVIGGALGILAGGLRLMTGTLAGAAALAVAAAALLLLAPALLALGNLGWDTIVKGLVTLGAALAVLGVAGALISASIPALLGLGAALVLVGAAVALTGVGLTLISAAISTLAVAGPAGLGILLDALLGVVEAVPTFAVAVVKALLAMVMAIAEAAPQFVTHIAQIVIAMAEGIALAAPAVAKALVAVLAAGLLAIAEKADEIFTAGGDILYALVKGIGDNITRMTIAGADAVIKFLTAIAQKAPELVAAGATALVKFLDGIAQNLPKVVASAAKVLTAYLTEVARQLPSVIKAGADVVVSILKGVAQNIGRVISAGTDLIVQFIKGMGQSSERVVRAARETMTKFINTLATEALKLANEGAKTIIRFINGIAAAIRQYQPQLIAAGANVGRAIIDGTVQGFRQLNVTQILGSIFSNAVNGVKSMLGIRSPSRVFAEIGRNMVDGAAGGIRASAPGMEGEMRSTAQRSVDILRNTLGEIPKIIQDVTDVDPVIRPVLDISQVRASAKELGSLTQVEPSAASYLSAAAVSDAQRALLTEPASSQDRETTVQPINLTQNNYSPESLPAAEIYRKTKNLLGLTKTELGLEL